MKTSFIYCYSDKFKRDLEDNNYTFVRKTKYKGKEAYMFLNDGDEIKLDKLNFSENELEFSSKMYC